MDFLRWILPGEYREEISELTIMYQPPNAIMAKADKGSIPPSLISTGAYQAFAIEAIVEQTFPQIHDELREMNIIYTILDEEAWKRSPRHF
ncbi:hypothetical protein [Caldivirga sp.]|uniref:hypothetical protein n=1 Tax=Caldivirga sp. TaxID=2080243 RepID=UPI0025BF84C5|nr:hypothetical protein [Caldivirga sp.]